MLQEHILLNFIITSACRESEAHKIEQFLWKFPCKFKQFTISLLTHLCLGGTFYFKWISMPLKILSQQNKKYIDHVNACLTLANLHAVIMTRCLALKLIHAHANYFAKLPPIIRQPATANFFIMQGPDVHQYWKSFPKGSLVERQPLLMGTAKKSSVGKVRHFTHTHTQTEEESFLFEQCPAYGAYWHKLCFSLFCRSEPSYITSVPTCMYTLHVCLPYSIYCFLSCKLGNFDTGKENLVFFPNSRSATTHETIATMQAVFFKRDLVSCRCWPLLVGLLFIWCMAQL